MGGYIALAVVGVFLLILWRRRAARRTAKATERLADYAMHPMAPPGKYPAPGRRRRQATAPGLVCRDCGRWVPPSGTALVLVDVCPPCQDLDLVEGLEGYGGGVNGP